MYYQNGITITDFGMKCKFFLDIKYVIVKVHFQIKDPDIRQLHTLHRDYSFKNLDFFHNSYYSINKRSADITDQNGCGYSQLWLNTTVFYDGAHSTCASWMGFFHALYFHEYCIETTGTTVTACM